MDHFAYHQVLKIRLKLNYITINVIISKVMFVILILAIMEVLVFNQVQQQHIVNVRSVIQVTCVNFNRIHVLQILAKMEVYAHLFSIQTVIIFTLAVV